MGGLISSRNRKRQLIRISLDDLRASLDQQYDIPKYDFELLTSRELRVYKKLKTRVTHDGTNWIFAQLDDMQLIYLRALLRKAAGKIEFNSPTSPEDRTDIRYLEKIKMKTFDAECICPYG